MNERTSWDGAMFMGLGPMILFFAPLAKNSAGALSFTVHGQSGNQSNKELGMTPNQKKNLHLAC